MAAGLSRRVLGADRGADGRDSLRRDVPGVERVEHQLDTERDVVPVQLREAVVVADQRPAADAVDVPGAEVAARAVMISIGAAEEPFVIPSGDLAAVADHVQAVVRCADVAEPVRGPGHHPDTQVAGEFPDPVSSAGPARPSRTR